MLPLALAEHQRLDAPSPTRSAAATEDAVEAAKALSDCYSYAGACQFQHQREPISLVKRHAQGNRLGPALESHGASACALLQGCPLYAAEPLERARLRHCGDAHDDFLRVLSPHWC